MSERFFVGAGLARDAGALVCQSHRGDAIAGKPHISQLTLTHGLTLFDRGLTPC